MMFYISYVQEIITLLLFLTAPILSGLTIKYFFSFIKDNNERKSKWINLIVGNVLIFVFLCSSALLLCELYYRYIYNETAFFKHTKATDHWYRRHWRLNLIGVRDSRESYKYRKLSNQYRISFIGDSITAGQGIANVENRFVNQIRNLHKDWDVYVFAKDGMNTGDELRYLKQLIAKKYESDIFVLIYYLNDIEDLSSDYQYYLNSMMESFKITNFWIRNSYFINTLYYRWAFTHDPSFAEYFDLIQEAYEQEAWKMQKNRLRNMQKLIEENGSRLLVVTFPFMHTIGSDYAFRRIHRNLDSFWQEIDVPHLDLLQIYDSYSSEALVVNPYDPHPNERAHTLAAKHIAAFIDKHLQKNNGT